MNKETTSKGIIKAIVETEAKFGFKPNLEFYNKVNINRKRWGSLFSEKKEPTITELQDICAFFETDIKKYI